MDQMLDGVTQRWNLLRHSFYQRWTQGALTREELCDYVEQYAHVVRAVPGWLEQVRGGDTSQSARHAAEESSHIALWERFGEALGLSSDAIRSTPANAATAAKLAGLSTFYGIGLDAGGEYFAVHQELDVEHSAELRALCSDGSQEAAALMSQALWDLLTSVDVAPQPV